MNNTLYLHVGWPKTGTSSIQLFLSNNSEMLKVAGIYYPETFNFERNNNNAYGQGNGFPLAYNMLTDKSVTVCRDKFDLNDFKSELSKGFRNLLFSTEWFTELNTNALKLLNDISAMHGYKVKVIAYLRPFYDFFNSEIGQAIKLGRNLDAIYPVNLKDPYKEKLVVFSEVFGRDNLECRIFEKSTWKNEDLVDDFLDFLGGTKNKNFKRVNVTNEAINFPLLVLHRNFLKYRQPLPLNFLESLDKLMIRNKYVDGQKFSWVSAETFERFLTKNEGERKFYKELVGENKANALFDYSPKSHVAEAFDLHFFEKLRSMVVKSAFYNMLPEPKKSHVNDLFNMFFFDYHCDENFNLI